MVERSVYRFRVFFAMRQKLHIKLRWFAVSDFSERTKLQEFWWDIFLSFFLLPFINLDQDINVYIILHYIIILSSFTTLNCVIITSILKICIRKLHWSQTKCIKARKHILFRKICFTCFESIVVYYEYASNHIVNLNVFGDL